MTLTTSFNIQRALVRTLRASSANSGLPGDWHEGIAPRDTAMPFGTYTEHPTALTDTHTSRLIVASYDVWIVAKDQVEANNLDAAFYNDLEDGLLTVDGQTTLYCRRQSDLRDKEETEAGDMIYRAGGTYSIWTDQSL